MCNIPLSLNFEVVEKMKCGPNHVVITIFAHHSPQSSNAKPLQLNYFRMVPTIVTVHTFCTSRDTRVSYGWCLLIQGYFCAV